MLGGRAVRKRALGMERNILRRFDIVSTISPEMRAQLREKSPADQGIEIFPNWVGGSSIYPMSIPSRLLAAEAVPTEATVALYSGSLVAKQGLEVIIDAARLLTHRRDIIFVICGDGPLKDKLSAHAAGLSHVRFLSLQPHELFNELLNLADIHLLSKASNISDLVMPSKLGPMLASGRPDIAAVNPAGSIAKAVGTAGQFVPVGDAPALAAAIVELADHSDRRHVMAAGARRQAMSIDREPVLTRIEVALLALLTRPVPRTQT